MLLPVHAETPLPDQMTTSLLMSWIFSPHVCTVGTSGEELSIFSHVSGPATQEKVFFVMTGAAKFPAEHISAFDVKSATF